MKKILSRLCYLLLAGVSLAVLGGLLRWFDSTHEYPKAFEELEPVAQWLDAKSVSVIHLPDVNHAINSMRGAHFTELGLHDGLAHIADQLLEDFPEFAHWQSILIALQRAQAKHFTIAVSTRAEEPEILVLFQSPTSAENAWDHCLEWWKSKDTSATIRTTHETLDGIRLTHATSGDGALTRATRNGWHVMSNTADAVRRTLTQMVDGQGSQFAPLGQDPVFLESLRPLRSGYLALGYVKDTQPPISAAEPTREPEGEEEMEAKQDGDGSLKIFRAISRQLRRLDARSAAFSISTKNGRVVEEAMFVPHSSNSSQKQPQPLPDTSNLPHTKTLPLTSQNTLAFTTTNVGAARIRQALFGKFEERWKASKLPPLKKIALTWPENFGPTWSLQLEPIETLSSSDSADLTHDPLAAILAMELADTEALRAQFETLASIRGSGVRRSQVDTYQLVAAFLPKTLTNLLPEVHLQVNHDLLLLSDQFRAIHQVGRRWHLNQGLQKRSDFKKLLEELPTPSAGLAFIDAIPILKRGSEAIQHPLVFATLWMGIRSQTHLDIDLKPFRSPASTDIQVVPTLATWERSAQGYHASSIGTLSPSQWVIGGSAIVAGIDNTFLETTPLTESEDFTSPPLEEELLQMMER